MSQIADELEISQTWRHFWLGALRILAKVGFLFLGPLESRGKYRIPRTGGVLILPNHISDCDPVAVQGGCPRLIRFMAKSELFEIPIIGTAVRLGGAISVRQGEPDRGALRKAIELLKRGEAVCVFPEGQLSESGELQELKSGVGLIARAAACPVICCGIRNTNRIVRYGSVIPRPSFRKTLLMWGEPRSFGKESEVAEVVEWVAAQLRELTS